MKILIIHNYYKNRGGEDTVFENESKALKEKGYEVIRYIRHNDELQDYSALKKLFFPLLIIKNNKAIKDLKKIIKNNDIDIAHVHNVFPLISPYVYHLLRKHNIKIVQTLHNYRFLCPNGVFYTKKKNCQLCMNGNFFHCIINKCYKNSYIYSFLYAYVIKMYQKIFKNEIDMLIPLTKFSKNIFLKAGYNKEKLSIKDNAYYNKEIKRAPSQGYFLFLGRLSPEKGIEFLLESFKKMPQYKLVVAGIGKKLDKLKKQYDMPNIEFKGFIDGAKKVDLIIHAEALLVPSVWYENYPITIIEAFCYGIPVIGSRIGGIPYIISDSQNGLLFEKNNFNSLANQLKLLYKNKTLRDTLGDNARKVFLERMEINANIKRLEEIYRKLTNGKN